ncbi:hypothetical protein N9176_01450 [bacterium]|nr:hypothetical protein [bacterium]
MYCFIQYLSVDSAEEIMKWGIGSLMLLLSISMLKIYAWMQMDKNAILREMKRLELQVMSLSGKMAD